VIRTLPVASAAVRPLAAEDPLAHPELSRVLVQDYLLWDAWVAGKRRVDVHPIVLSPEIHRAAVLAAESTVRAITEVAALAHREPLERARYKLHPDVLRLARASREMGDDAGLFRVDLLFCEDGTFRACEVNADCPGGHNEALALPRLARTAGATSFSNPTVVVERLVERLRELADGGTVALVFATAYAEDLQICALIQKQLKARGVDAILTNPTAPRLRNGELWAQGRPIRVLYRYFPAEYMEGQRNLGDIERALRFGTLKTISSFEHIFTQSKLAFSRAWARKNQVSEASRATIETHVPETLEVPEVPLETLLAERERWVVKRALGRVGDEVFVGPLFSQADWAALVPQVVRRATTGESWIAQRFVRQTPVSTPWGARYLTLGAYVQDGHFTGYFTRATPESHVSHDALCLPVLVA
jgi:glutathionylspermidine synthase